MSKVLQHLVDEEDEMVTDGAPSAPLFPPMTAAEASVSLFRLHVDL